MIGARCSGAQRQRGLSLIEIMVAVVLGLVLTLALMQLMISNRDAHRWQQNLTLLQENGRFAAEKVAQVVRMTAYQGSTGSQWLQGPLSLGNGGLVPLAGTDDDTNGSDTLQVAYQGTADGFVKNCQGISVGAGVVVLNRLSISAAGDLECAVSTNGGTTWNTLPMVTGVEALHVLYGLDSDGDGSANLYVGAADVADMEDVVSVRIGLLLVSRDDGLVAVTDDTAYAVLDATVHPGTGPGDRRARRLMVTTVKLRNQS